MLFCLRQGSGFKEITETYYTAHNYRDELGPKFYSDASSFQVTLYNVNYGQTIGLNVNQLFESLLLSIKSKKTTKEAMVTLYRQFGFDTAFTRANIIRLIGRTSSPTGALIDKLKAAGLVEPVTGQERLFVFHLST